MHFLIEQNSISINIPANVVSEVNARVPGVNDKATMNYFKDTFCWHGLTLILTWASNCIHYKKWGEIS